VGLAYINNSVEKCMTVRAERTLIHDTASTEKAMIACKSPLVTNEKIEKRY
jgi:hypothetical protein